MFARPVDRTDARNTLPLTDDRIAPGALPENVMPVWVSEAMVDLYGYRVGEKVTLPIGATSSEFLVAGVWRDYGRQFGAVQMQLADYKRLTGDLSVNTVALWLQTGMTPDAAIANLRQLSFGAALEISRSSDMRALSLSLIHI